MKSVVFRISWDSKEIFVQTSNVQASTQSISNRKGQKCCNSGKKLFSSQVVKMGRFQKSTFISFIFTNKSKVAKYFFDICNAEMAQNLRSFRFLEFFRFFPVFSIFSGRSKSRKNMYGHLFHSFCATNLNFGKKDNGRVK